MTGNLKTRTVTSTYDLDLNIVPDTDAQHVALRHAEYVALEPNCAGAH